MTTAAPTKKTSRKQVPATFKLVDKQEGWVDGAVNLDIGCGKWPELLTEQLEGKGVKNLYVDTEWFDRDHNNGVYSEVRMGGGADTVTVNNVFNVIQDDNEILKIVNAAYRHLRKGGTLYVLIHEGSKSGTGRKTRDGYQRNAKAEDYLRFITPPFRNVKRKGNLIMATKGT